MRGPDSFRVWALSWGVWRACVIMHQAAKVGTLRAYFACIEELDLQYSRYGCWHIICRAEDRARSEHLERLLRSAEATFAGAPLAAPPTGFNPARPWDWCLSQLSDSDHAFWRREVGGGGSLTPLGRGAPGLRPPPPARSQRGRPPRRAAG